jgi:hypothetical protein
MDGAQAAQHRDGRLAKGNDDKVVEVRDAKSESDDDWPDVDELAGADLYHTYLRTVDGDPVTAS